MGLEATNNIGSTRIQNGKQPLTKPNTTVSTQWKTGYRLPKKMDRIGLSETE